MAGGVGQVEGVVAAGEAFARIHVEVGTQTKPRTGHGVAGGEGQ